MSSYQAEIRPSVGRPRFKISGQSSLTARKPAGLWKIFSSRAAGAEIETRRIFDNLFDGNANNNNDDVANAHDRGM